MMWTWSSTVAPLQVSKDEHFKRAVSHAVEGVFPMDSAGVPEQGVLLILRTGAQVMDLLNSHDSTLVGAGHGFTECAVN